jgi:hypothetical protein
LPSLRGTASPFWFFTDSWTWSLTLICSSILPTKFSLYSIGAGAPRELIPKTCYQSVQLIGRTQEIRPSFTPRVFSDYLSCLNIILGPFLILRLGVTGCMSQGSPKKQTQQDRYVQRDQQERNWLTWFLVLACLQCIGQAKGWCRSPVCEGWRQTSFILGDLHLCS